MVKYKGGYTVETVFDGSKLGIEPYSVEVTEGGELLVMDSMNSIIYRMALPLSQFDAIMAIKIEYGVKKIWIGDPCVPTKYTREGVKCSSASGNTSRITSLDLSNGSFHGTISKNFTLFTALENLDLSYNQLSGSIPDAYQVCLPYEFCKCIFVANYYQPKDVTNHISLSTEMYLATT